MCGVFAYHPAVDCREGKLMMTLAEYYAALGYTSDQRPIGLKHPYLENYALRLIEKFLRARVLEIGYQAGGFA